MLRKGKGVMASKHGRCASWVGENSILLSRLSRRCVEAGGGERTDPPPTQHARSSYLLNTTRRLTTSQHWIRAQIRAQGQSTGSERCRRKEFGQHVPGTRGKTWGRAEQRERNT